MTMRSITPNDLVAEVVARGGDAIIDVFVRHAPHFQALHDAETRRVMGRLVTVAQAAATAGVTAETLVRDLNIALGIGPDHAAETPDDSSLPGPPLNAPGRPAHWPETLLDVREDLRAGREPFPRIMAAIGALPKRQVLQLRAPFEPVPLLAVLARRGFAHEVARRAEDDWSVWFWREVDETDANAGTVAAPPQDDAVADEPAHGSPRERWLDVRDLEPPEPLVRTLSALESLPIGHTLVQVNVRTPQHLLPILAERGYTYEIEETPDDTVLVRVRHRS